MRRGLWRVLAVNLLVFVALLGALELGARVLFRRDLRVVFNDPAMFVRGRPFVTPHPSRGFALTPGFQNDTYRVNRAGFRGDDLPEDWRAERPILALGASSTFGWRVQDDECWPAQLQSILAGRARVINAAVPSYTSAQARAYLDELLEVVKPSAVLVDALWNDALFACIDNWMPEILVHQQPARWRQWLLRYSGLYRALALEPADSVERPPTRNAKAVAFFGENMQAIARACNERGIGVVFVRPTIQTRLLPESGMRIGPRSIPPAFFEGLLADFDRELVRVARETQAVLVSHPIVLGNDLPDSLFLDPAHPTPHGYTLVARDIAAALMQRQLVAEAR